MVPNNTYTAIPDELLTRLHAAALVRYREIHDRLVAEVPRIHTEDWQTTADVPMTVELDGQEYLYQVRWDKKNKVFVNLHWVSPDGLRCYQLIPESINP